MGEKAKKKNFVKTLKYKSRCGENISTINITDKDLISRK